MILGLTGGIASGKSLVVSYMQEMGVPVIDTDEIARQVVAPGQPAWQQIRDWLGPDYFLPDGAIDRPAVARRVFVAPADRLRLEAITHPAIFAEVDRRLAALHAVSTPPLIVVDVPLLFEVGAEERFDAVALVWSTPEQQRARLMQARGYSAEEADARIAAQRPLAEKLSRAHYIIDNSGGAAATRAQVQALVQRLTGNLPR